MAGLSLLRAAVIWFGGPACQAAAAASERFEKVSVNLLTPVGSIAYLEAPRRGNDRVLFLDQFSSRGFMYTDSPDAGKETDYVETSNSSVFRDSAVYRARPRNHCQVVH